jgi:hypothetical protein
MKESGPPGMMAVYGVSLVSRVGQAVPDAIGIRRDQRGPAHRIDARRISCVTFVLMPENKDDCSALALGTLNFVQNTSRQAQPDLRHYCAGADFADR